MNVHKRCQKNVANNCGINPKQIALLLEELGLSDNNNVPAAKSKVSEILNGKRKADIPFLKGIHKVLKIDASLLLEKV